MVTEINRVGYNVREVRIVDDRGQLAASFGTELVTELAGGRYVTLPAASFRVCYLKKSKPPQKLFSMTRSSVLKSSPTVWAFN